MNARQRSFLVNLNRVVIFALTLTGLLMDGFQRPDLPCTVALLVWLWLPLCTRMEASLMGWLGRIRSHVGSARVTPSV